MSEPREPRSLEEALGVDVTEFSDAAGEHIDDGDVSEDGIYDDVDGPESQDDPDGEADTDSDDPDRIEGSLPKDEYVEAEAETEADDEAEESEEDADLEDDDSGEAEDGEAPEGESRSDTDEGDIAAQAETEPLTFRADGRDFNVAGAEIHTVEVDGETRRMIVMPEDTFHRQIQPHVADRRAFYDRINDLEAEIQAYQNGEHPEAVEMAVVFKGLMDALGSQEAFEDFTADFERNRDILKANAKNARLEAQLKRGQARDDQAQHVRRVNEAAETIRTDLPTQIQGVAQEMGFELTPQMQEMLYNRLVERSGIYVEVTDAADDPYRQQGYAPGLYANLPVIQAEIEFVKTLRPAEPKTREGKRRKRNNDAVLGKGKKRKRPATPAAVAAKTTPASALSGEDWMDVDYDSLSPADQVEYKRRWRAEMGSQ